MGLRPGIRFLLVLAALGALSPLVVAADRPTGVLIADRHSITAEFTLLDGDDYAIDLCELDLLTVSVKAGKGASDLRCFIALRRPDGHRPDISDWMKKPGTSSPALKSFPVPDGLSGPWTIELNGGSGSGPYTITIKIKRAKPIKQKKLVVPAGGAIYLPVVSDAGGQLSVSVKEKDGGPLEAVTLLDPDGQPVDPGESPLVRKKKKITGKGIPLERPWEEYSLELTGHATSDTIVDVKVSVKYPRPERRKATLPPELEITSWSPETVRQEERDVEIRLKGVNFLPETDLEVTGAGVVVTKEELQLPGRALLLVDVGEDAPYGYRDICLYPPPSLGEPVVLRDAIRVLAPKPAITSVSGGPIRQGDTEKTIELLGTGFRDGGDVSFSEESIVVRSVEILSSTLARAVVDVALDAPLGPVYVTYSQPAAGGGSAVVEWGALDLLYPVPTVTSIAPDRLLRGMATSVVLAGAGFRDGGAVTLGEDIEITNLTLVSPSEIRFDIEIAETAVPGDRDVIYEHPSDGGGEEARIVDGFRVLKLVELRLIGTDTDASDRFGESVDTDGDTIVVGAPLADGDTDWSGAAYVFGKSEGKWVQQAKLVAGDAKNSARFGEAVLVRGDLIVIGAPVDDYGGTGRGSVYVFTRTDGTWSRTAKLNEDQEYEANPKYGAELDMDGDTLLVGAPEDYPTMWKDFRGSGYLYKRSGSDWTLQEKVWNKYPEGSEYGGTGAAVSGDTAVLGAPFHRGDLNNYAIGAAAVFVRSGTDWRWQTTFNAPGALDSETHAGRFGYCIALETGTLAVADDGDKGYSGAVYVYTGQTNTWTLQQKITPDVRYTNGFFGHSIDLEGDTLLVGATYHGEGGSDTGAVLVFRRESDQWTQAHLFQPKDAAANDYFGVSVAIGDSFYVAGSSRDDDEGEDSGSVSVFSLE